MGRTAKLHYTSCLDGVWIKIKKVGIDANLKPLKCLKDQTEAAIANRPHICQLRTLLRVENFDDSKWQIWGLSDALEKSLDTYGANLTHVVKVVTLAKSSIDQHIYHIITFTLQALLMSTYTYFVFGKYVLLLDPMLNSLSQRLLLKTVPSLLDWCSPDRYQSLFKFVPQENILVKMAWLVLPPGDSFCDWYGQLLRGKPYSMKFNLKHHNNSVCPTI